jgi:hypothetical protein
MRICMVRRKQKDANAHKSKRYDSLLWGFLGGRPDRRHWLGRHLAAHVLGNSLSDAHDL